MIKFLKHIYLTKLFFIVASILTGLFIFSYIFSGILVITKMLFFIAITLVVIDVLLVFIQKGIIAKRELPEKLSNGDDNIIKISIANNYNFKVKLEVIDELPFQYQKRDFNIKTTLNNGKTKDLSYTLRPLERGEYLFGHLNIYATSPIQFICRRYQFGKNAMVPNYPSFLQLRKFMLLAFSNRLFEHGIKKIRRIGHTLEFEQIKDYIPGDDIRTINWKATAKRNQLMVNQYQDERSQPIYSVIDKGRTMKMPFNGLSLLDYAINSTLVISNVAIKKQDKAGMFTFSNKVENKVNASKKSSQMHSILETLYNVKTNFIESDFERLYIDIKRGITQRSLILMYTNFETIDALHRQLPYLKAIAKQHLLVVVCFRNTELDKIAKDNAKNTFEIFQNTIAEKFKFEKKLIINELNKNGIQSILTSPEDLTINTINKYLEIKARGLL